MIRYFYYYLIDFKEIHPLRFYALLASLILLFSAMVYSIIRYRNKKSTIQQATIPEEPPTQIPESKSTDTPLARLTSILKNHKVLIRLNLVQFFIIIGLVVALSAINLTDSKRIENPSISSSKYIFGIDISHYQGHIDWEEMRTSHHPIQFVFIRATMGTSGVDHRFHENWRKAKQHNYIRGAYHYYRPNENSTIQFENFSRNAKLVNGDLAPVLDIEKQSRYGNKNLVKGVLNWLHLAEKKYGTKPIIYTGLTFYLRYLKGHVDDYPLWIAAYAGKHRVKHISWTFHQFTERVSVKGIQSTVDGNDFKGEYEDLLALCIN